MKSGLFACVTQGEKHAARARENCYVAQTLRKSLCHHGDRREHAPAGEDAAKPSVTT